MIVCLRIRFNVEGQDSYLPCKLHHRMPVPCPEYEVPRMPVLPTSAASCDVPLIGRFKLDGLTKVGILLTNRGDKPFAENYFIISKLEL